MGREDSTSLWYDNWSNLGLIHMLAKDDISGKKNMLLKELLQNGARRKSTQPVFGLLTC